MAFDYQLLAKQKKNKFLWEVRFSIREHTNAFDKRMEGDDRRRIQLLPGATATVYSMWCCPRAKSRSAR